MLLVVIMMLDDDDDDDDDDDSDVRVVSIISIVYSFIIDMNNKIYDE